MRHPPSGRRRPGGDAGKERVQPWTNKHWLVSRRATVRVIETDGVITEAAPLARRFIGQPLPNLMRWFERTFGAYAIETEFNCDDHP